MPLDDDTQAIRALIDAHFQGLRWAFIARMKAVAQSSLRSFEEKTLGMQILQFGNVAVVLSASEMIENGSEVNHDVSGYLLLKDSGKWRIAAHAWDHAPDRMPVPQHLRHA